MPHMLSIDTGTRSRRQAYMLLFFGILSLAAAWLLHLDPFAYPVGVLVSGIGILLAAFFYPQRLLIAGCIVTVLGVAIFLAFKHLLPGNQIFPTYILALGIGLLFVAFFARRGYIGIGAITPAILVIVVGIIEVLLVAGLTPPNFLPFMLSLWLPGTSLLILGIMYFLASSRRL